MARREVKPVGGESAAFEKLTAGLRYAIEASTELGVRQGRAEWTKVAMAMQKMLALVNQLHISSRVKMN